MNIKERLVPAYEDMFYERFPLLFADVLAGTKSVSPLTDWGIECGAGWRRIIETLCEDLEAIIRAMPLSERTAYRAMQVKQKWQLRFYMTRETPEMSERIGRAVDESADVCELCGAPVSEKRRWPRPAKSGACRGCGVSKQRP
jgi:hypothetical protein